MESRAKWPDATSCLEGRLSDVWHCPYIHRISFSIIPSDSVVLDILLTETSHARDVTMAFDESRNELSKMSSKAPYCFEISINL